LDNNCPALTGGANLKILKSKEDFFVFQGRRFLRQSQKARLIAGYKAAAVKNYDCY